MLLLWWMGVQWYQKQEKQEQQQQQQQQQQEQDSGASPLEAIAATTAIETPQQQGEPSGGPGGAVAGTPGAPLRPATPLGPAEQQEPTQSSLSANSPAPSPATPDIIGAAALNSEGEGCVQVGSATGVSSDSPTQAPDAAPTAGAVESAGSSAQQATGSGSSRSTLELKEQPDLCRVALCARTAGRMTSHVAHESGWCVCVRIGPPKNCSAWHIICNINPDQHTHTHAHTCTHQRFCASWHVTSAGA